jgi:hypothetical protein
MQAGVGLFRATYIFFCSFVPPSLAEARKGYVDVRMKDRPSSFLFPSSRGSLNIKNKKNLSLARGESKK